MDEFLQLARSLYPYLPDAVLNKFVDYYAASDNNTDVALGKLRQDPIYDTYFPGNKREDKTVRYNESEYLAVKENYKFTLEDYGINAELFEDTFSNLIAGDVSPSEFKTRIAVTFEGIAVPISSFLTTYQSVVCKEEYALLLDAFFLFVFKFARFFALELFVITTVPLLAS